MLKFQKHFQPPSPPNPKLYSEGAVAKALNLSLSTMARLRKDGQIPFIKLGAQIRYTPELIQEIIQVLTVPVCLKTVSKSGNTTSPANTIPQSGKQPGTTAKNDKLAAHHLAQKTFKTQKSL